MKKRLIVAFVLIGLAWFVADACSPGVQRRRRQDGWEPPKALLGSTPERRRAVAKRLEIAEGGWVVLIASPKCDRCDRVATELKSLMLAGLPGFRVVALLEAPPEAVDEWRERLGIRYRTMAVSATDFEDFAGPVAILPTVVLLNNGVAKAVRETAPQAYQP